MVLSRGSAVARIEGRQRDSVASRHGDLATRAIALGIVVTLAIDAYLHATSAALHDPRHAGFLTAGNFFRFETAVRALVALLVLIRPARWSLVAALAVAATGLGTVILYRYVNVGPIGPIPNLYEPSWHVPGKLASAFAGGIVVVLSAAGLALIARSRAMRAATPRLAAVAQAPAEPSALAGSRETRRIA